MKDPAVLFYFQDFLVGTEFMTDEEVGKYIRILCHQADKGSLTKSQLLRICRTNEIPEAIKEKLKVDENGNYYQNRMKLEREKRCNYSESRRKNRLKKEDNICISYDTHMENENENENINIDNNINEDNNNTWRKNFEIYKNELRESYNTLISDKEYIETQEKYNPNVDIQLSIEKACVNYWATEAGWKHKKKSRSKELDWKSTLTKAIDFNKVYKNKFNEEKIITDVTTKYKRLN